MHATAILTAPIKNGSILDLDSHVHDVLSARYHDVVSMQGYQLHATRCLTVY